VILPPSGVLNYTSLHIPPGKRIGFRPSLRNTPGFLLAQGDMALEGAIFVVARRRVDGRFRKFDDLLKKGQRWSTARRDLRF
jgi:hypothetical protein